MSEPVTAAQDGEVGWDEELRHWLEVYIAKHPHHSTKVLSRSHYIGVSRQALDTYLAKTYFLPKTPGGKGINPSSSKLERAIRAYRDHVEGTVRHGYQNTFVATRTWHQLRRACALAIDENAIVIAYGKPGVGKSRCLVEYAVQQMTTAPVALLCSRNITTRYLVQKMAAGLGLDPSRSIAHLEDAIAEKLRRTPRPIFVDQANYLNERALGAVCYIWELARIPVVLVGTKELYNLFMSSRLTDDIRAQLSSRIAVQVLLSELTLAEAKAIVERALGKEATPEVVAQIYTITGGIHRHVDQILPRILQLKATNQDKLDRGEITMTHIIATAGARLLT